MGYFNTDENGNKTYINGGTNTIEYHQPIAALEEDEAFEAEDVEEDPSIEPDESNPVDPDDENPIETETQPPNNVTPFPTSRPAPSKNTEVLLDNADDIEISPISWLWPNRIARGKITMIAGIPGLGKSQITLTIGAIISNGGQWPDGSPSTVGSVLICSAEDDASDTIKPRLIAAKADLTKVYILNGVKRKKKKSYLDLSSDIDLIETKVNEIGDVSMIVIDPVSAYMGDTNSHKNTDVMELMSKLSDFAKHTNIAIVLVTHFNKNTLLTEPLSRVMGSTAFVAVSRTVFVVCEDPENTGSYLFVNAKNNIGPTGGGFRYTIEESVVTSGDIKTSRIKWVDGALDINASDIMTAPKTNPAREKVATWIIDYMAGKPVEAAVIIEAGAKCGYSASMLNRVKRKLNILSVKSESRGKSEWQPAIFN